MLANAYSKALSPDVPMSWGDAFLVATSAMSATLPIVAGLYLAKSALGINLMTGPSPLHDLLYWIVR